MRKSLLNFGLTLILGSGFVLAQSTAQQNPTVPQSPRTNQTPKTTPPTFPEGQQRNPEQAQPNNPDQANPAGQVGTPTSSLSQIQSQVQDAINKQLGSSNVTVSATDDGKLQLTGVVSSERDKQQAEDIARSAAPNQSIVNKISVGTPSTAYPR
ncbi:MAG TPA: BON domain-containing protein [Terriglobales bacterium]|nr:BON domain-containing protein [Terriglobales bacterium]